MKKTNKAPFFNKAAIYFDYFFTFFRYKSSGLFDQKFVILKTMKHFLLFCLLFTISAGARVSIEFDKDRIEAGAPFELRMIVPIQELAEQRETPRLMMRDGFVFRALDSMDTRTADFFGHGIRIRKYIFKLTAPKKVGSFSVGPLSWKVNDKEYELADRIPIEIKKSFNEGALSLSLTPNKKSVYEGEQFSLLLSMRTYEHFEGNVAFTGTELGNDFIAHRSDLKDLKFQPVPGSRTDMESSARFAWLAPMKSGVLTIPPIQVKYTKRGAPKVVEKNHSFGGFSSTFKSISQESVEAEAQSAPITLKVLSLPASLRPVDFTGMVGKYSFEAAFDKSELSIGEALTLNITIQGDGKPGTITDPKLPDFSDFRSVPPENTTSKTIRSGKVITTKTTKIFLYPKKRGTFVIPEITYNWFNPSKKAYETASQGPWEIQVEKGSEEDIATTTVPVPVTVQKQEIETLGQDIRFIHPLNHISSKAHAFYKTIPFWVLLFTPIPLYLLLAAFIRSHRKHISNGALMRKSKAQKNLKQQLQSAKTAMQKNDPRAFYASLEKSLIGFLSDLTNLEFQGMTREQMKETLQKQNLPETQIQQIDSLLEKCSSARFAPLSSISMEVNQEVLKQVEKLCSALEVLK